MKLLVKLGLVALVAATCWFGYKEYEYRQVNGRVVDINALNFAQEVASVSDQVPVVIYLYNGAAAEQLKEVQSFAWWNARRAKVVALDCSKIENKAIGFALLVFRYPAMVVTYKDTTVKGTEGIVSTRHEIERLLERALQESKAAQQPSAPTTKPRQAP